MPARRRGCRDPRAAWLHRAVWPALPCGGPGAAPRAAAAAECQKGSLRLAPHAPSLRCAAAQDLLAICRKCGIKGHKLALLVPDNHVLSERFLAHITELMISGDPVALCTQDERDAFCDGVRWCSAALC